MGRCEEVFYPISVGQRERAGRAGLHVGQADVLGSGRTGHEHPLVSMTS